MRILEKASGYAVVLAVFAAAGCASGGTPAAKPGDKPAAAAKPGAKPGDKAAPAKPGDKAAPAKPGAAPAAKTPPKPGAPKTAPKPAETAKAPPKPADPKTAPKPAEAAKTPPKPAPKTADPKAAPKPAEASKTPPKPTDPKTAPKPTTAKTPAKPADPKAAPKPTTPKTEAKPAAVAPASAGGPSGFEKFVDDLGKSFEDMKVLGMRFRPFLHEEIGYTDNVFYQADDEVIIVDYDPDGDSVLAVPGPLDPIGKVDDIFNHISVGFNLEMQVNSNLVPILEEGKNSLDVFGATLDWIEYLTEADSPDAVNYDIRLDLLTEFLKELLNMKTARTTWYARLEADYSQITDPLDVPLLQYQNTNPTLAFAGNRVDFTRNEWFVKPTIGFRGARFDGEASYRMYDFSVDDETLDSADHREHEFHGEIGWRKRASEHRFYGFVTNTIYDFPERGSSEDVPGLRNFDVWKAGPGWEGPAFSRKVRGNIEVYYLGMDVHQRHPPGRTVPIPNTSNVVGDPFAESDGWGAKTTWTYRPFVTKATTFQVEYERDLEWSVVSDYKTVDTGFVSLSHPISEKLTSNLKYSVTHENVSDREKRLYQEVGFGLRYRLMNYTHLTFQYAFRTMASSDEPETVFTDAQPEPFTIKADGDFTANIVSVGINFDF